MPNAAVESLVRPSAYHVYCHAHSSGCQNCADIHPRLLLHLRARVVCLHLRPRFRLRFTNEIAQGVEARDRQARLEEAQRQRQRQLELEDIVRPRQLREDILRQRQLEREDILYMVCRMFH